MLLALPLSPEPMAGRSDIREVGFIVAQGGGGYTAHHGRKSIMVFMVAEACGEDSSHLN